MKNHLPDAARRAIQNVIDRASASGEILDVYEAALKIKDAFPKENILIKDLVAFILVADIPALELSPRGLVVDFILPYQKTSIGTAPDHQDGKGASSEFGAIQKQKALS